MARYLHSFPPIKKKRRGYANLITAEEKAKMQYQRDMAFKEFVNRNNEVAKSYADHYKAYTQKYTQLEFAF